MALLEKVQRLSAECHKELIQFYESPGRRFPIEIRNLFAREIEQAVCGSELGTETVDGGLNPSNPTHFGPIREFLSNLIDRLEGRIDEKNNSELGLIPFFIRHKLTEALDDFKSRVSVDACGFFQVIRDCIQFELALIKCSLDGVADQPDVIMDQVDAIRKRISSTSEILKRIGAEQEAFEINCNERQTLDDYLGKVRTVKTPNEQTLKFEKSVTEKVTIVEGKLQGNVATMLSVMSSFEERVGNCVSEVSNLQALVLTKIQLWKYEQQQLANGMVQTNPISLNTLQVWCEELADLIWSTRQLLKDAKRLQDQNPILTSTTTAAGGETLLGRLIEHVTRGLSDLLSASFLVESQPPQVMKLGTRFPAPLKVSLLVGNRLNVGMTSPEVSTRIISEAQAKAVGTAMGESLPKKRIEASGEISNGNSKLEFNRELKRFVANFRSIQLKRIKRAERKSGSSGGNSSSSEQSVMEEKFCLLFESVVTVGELSIKIYAISLAVVVISHGSQEAVAVATILWDNAFGELGRPAFQVPSQVKWADLADVISLKFEMATGRGLNSDQLLCLRQKAIRKGSESISWSEFCKENLQGRSFSFWDWTYAALKILNSKETNLKEIWKEGLILGFIERQTAELLLTLKTPGTFLLRFSDSLVGAITIAWVHEDGNVYLVNPFQLHDLTNKKLSDSILDLEKLKFLYPDTPKDEAFGKYYSPPAPTGGYVTLKQTLTVPSHVDGEGSSSASSSPSRPTSFVTDLPFGMQSPPVISQQYPWSIAPSPGVSHLDASFQSIMNMVDTPMTTVDVSPSNIDKGSFESFPDFSNLCSLTTNHSNGQLDEAMQIPMDEQFADLMQVIGEDCWSGS